MSKDPVVLITGCSSGIGHHAAYYLRARGWRVLATCRKPQDCKRLEEAAFESFPLDQADPGSIAEATDRALHLSANRLEGVVLNGAYAMPAAVEDTPRAAMRDMLETNFLGPFEVIARLVPAMRRSGRGRIVNVSSVLGFTALRFRGPYCATKFAMEGMTDALRLELRGSGVHVSLLEPGPIATKIRENAIPHFERWIDWEASALRETYKTEVRPKLYAADNAAQDATRCSRLVHHALTASRPRARYRVTPQTHVAEFLRRALPTRWRDAILHRA